MQHAAPEHWHASEVDDPVLGRTRSSTYQPMQVPVAEGFHAILPLAAIPAFPVVFLLECPEIACVYFQAS